MSVPIKDKIVTLEILKLVNDQSVTRGKLADDIRASLNLADTAVQPSDIETVTDEEIEALFGPIDPDNPI